MRIIEISQHECSDLLKRVSVGRLGCASDNQPYVVPVRFSYEPDCIYIFSTVGQKIKWMRKNPKVCLQADEIGNPSNWLKRNSDWNLLGTECAAVPHRAAGTCAGTTRSAVL